MNLEKSFEHMYVLSFTCIECTCVLCRGCLVCHVVSMLVYCNCITTVLCRSLVCCMSSCSGVHLIELTVYRVSTKECKIIKS